MEKVAYVIGGSGLDGDALGGRLRGEVAARLLDLGAHGIQVNVADAAVAPAAAARISGSGRPPEAVVGVWVDSATDHLRAPFDGAFATLPPSTELAAYLVTESVPLRNERFPAAAGERTSGMAQLAFIQRLPGQSGEEFLAIWKGSHTEVALELQDTFAYVQQAVVRVLTPGAPPWDAIVEECFPAEAMVDPHAFFDAVGDDERLARHQALMFESVQRFIDLSKIEVVPTSRYVVQPVG